MADCTSTTETMTDKEVACTEKEIPDPLVIHESNITREGDHVILVFSDERQIFAQCVSSWKGKSPPVKVNKRSYPTKNLIGLPYGTVLELGRTKLVPLPEGQELLPDSSAILGQECDDDDDEMQDNGGKVVATPSNEQANDNRHLVDNNKSQSMNQEQVMNLRDAGAEGSEIVAALIENSATFEAKTQFSKAKYIARKQKKYQQRCRMVRCTAASICEALYSRDPRRLMNMREDTLAQILSYSNVSAGCQVLLVETCVGVVTGAFAQRMGGYGKVISVYSGGQPSYNDMLARFNLSYAENQSIKWIHSGEVFADDEDNTQLPNEPEYDEERAEREAVQWPCPLQDHTREYMEGMATTREKTDFLAKRSARFARKLTRQSAMEVKNFLSARACDSLVIVARYDPTATLLPLLRFLAPSCPFVVYCEFMEPLIECFREIQRQRLAINLRLTDTWMREYQVLPGRTHPNMNMSQNGGYLLVGIKLCPETGHNDLDDEVMKELKAAAGGRRGRRRKKTGSNGESETNGQKGRRKKRKLVSNGN